MPVTKQTKRFALRLDAEGEEAVKRALVALGQDGEKALKSMDVESRRLRRELDLVEKAGRSLRTTLRGAAAGFVAGLSLNALQSTFRNVLGDMNQLVDASQRIGLGTEALQEFRFAASQVGVETRTTDLALQRFTRRLGEAQQGGGELKATLEEYNIELREADGTARTAEAVLRDLTEAMKNAKSENERLLIQFKAFDSEGVGFGNALIGDFDRIIAEARELGLILDDELVQRGADLNREWDRLVDIIGSNAKRVIVGLATAAREAFGGGSFLADFEKSSATLQAELDKLEIRLEGYNRDDGPLARIFFNMEERIKVTRERIAELNALIEIAENREKKGLPPPSADPGTEDDPGAERRAAQIEKVTAGLRFQEQQLERTSVQQKVYNSLRKAGLADAETVVDVQGRLIGVYSLEAEQIAESVRAIESRRAAQAAAATAEEAETKRIADAVKRVEKARDAEAAARDRQIRQEFNDALKREKEAWDELNSVLQSLKTSEERLAETQGVLNAALDEGRLSQDEYAEASKRLADQQVAAAEKAELLADGVKSGLSRALRGGMDDMADFSDFMLGQLDRLIDRWIDFIDVQQLGDAVSGIFSAGVGSGASDFTGTTVPGEPIRPLAVAEGAAFDGGNVVPFVRGGVVDEPTYFPLRRGLGLMGEAGPEGILPLHRHANGDLGVRADLSPVAPVVQVTPPAPVMNVTIHNHAGEEVKVRQEQRRRPGGGIDLRVMVEKEVERALNQGRLDQALANNMGLRRTPIQR